MSNPGGFPEIVADFMPQGFANIQLNSEDKPTMFLTTVELTRVAVVVTRSAI
jgi:hypothetical protein